MHEVIFSERCKVKGIVAHPHVLNVVPLGTGHPADGAQKPVSRKADRSVTSCKGCCAGTLDAFHFFARGKATGRCTSSRFLRPRSFSTSAPPSGSRTASTSPLSGRSGWAWYAASPTSPSSRSAQAKSETPFSPALWPTACAPRWTACSALARA
jgi:hypothetical protein